MNSEQLIAKRNEITASLEATRGEPMSDARASLRDSRCAIMGALREALREEALDRRVAEEPENNRLWYLRDKARSEKERFIALSHRLARGLQR